MRLLRLTLGVALAVFVLNSGLAHAQATITGVVKDTSGAVLPCNCGSEARTRARWASIPKARPGMDRASLLVAMRSGSRRGRWAHLLSPA